jgi:mannose/fructose/N-acetylgalactosamine-specific phosphotransferase system component IIC
MDVIKMEPDLDSDTGSLFVCSDIQLTAAQQADVALVEVIATQQKVIQKIKNRVDTATVQEAIPVSATLSVKSQVKVRHISSE